MSSGEESEDFVAFMNNLDFEDLGKGKSKEADNLALSPSGSEFDGEEGEPAGGEEESDDEEEEEEGDEKKPRNYGKDEHKARSPDPNRGKANTSPCEACRKKGRTCYSQNTLKNRGACYHCGKMKNKCNFPVSIFQNLN
jgi:hypothetical protein